MDKEKNILTIIYNKRFKIMNGHPLENNINDKKPITLWGDYITLTYFLKKSGIWGLFVSIFMCEEKN